MLTVEKPNIILIVMDSFRYDRLSRLGYSRKGKKTTPNIDSFCSDSIFFKMAFSPGPDTRQVMPSIFTGIYPSNSGFSGVFRPIDPSFRTLTQILSSNGYATCGIATIPYIRNLNEGFDEFLETYRIRKFKLDLHWLKSLLWRLFNGYDKDTGYIVSRMKQYCQSSKKSLFLYSHLMNPHVRFDPPRKFKKDFVIQPKQINENVDKILNCRPSAHIEYLTGKITATSEEWDFIESMYDGEVAYLDDKLGEFFRWLERERLYDDCLIILTADHGENFGKGRLISHGWCLYEELIHVPLIIKLPGNEKSGEEIDEVVSTVDILPTILDYLGIKEKLDLDGVSLVPFENRQYHPCVFSEMIKQKGLKEKLDKLNITVNPPGVDGLKCARSKQFKFVISPNMLGQLFIPEEDPEEKIDVSTKYPAETEFLKNQLLQSLASSFGEESEEERIRQKIRQLKGKGKI